MTGTANRVRPSGPPAALVRGRPGGIGRSGSPRAEAISDALRRWDNPGLHARRRLAGLSLGAIGSLGVVAAYQFGLVRRVPEPRLPGLDANAVDATGAAYRLLSTPDAALGIASYAGTLVLAGMGGADRARTAPWLSLLTAGKVALDVAGGGYLLAEQLTKHRRLCSWCTAATVLSVASLRPAAVEARVALAVLRDRARA